MMYKEIGSEFWDMPVSQEDNGIFPLDTMWYLSGRMALKAIIKDIKSKKKFETVKLPSWCCDSMIQPFVDEGVAVSFYPVRVIDGRLKIDVDTSADAILVMDYFGFLNDTEYSDSDTIVIRDTTHTVLNNIHKDADYYFGSVRKWCGALTGGFAYGKAATDSMLSGLNENAQYVSLRSEAMGLKRAYIMNNGPKNFLDIYRSAENILDESKDIFVADYEDVSKIKKLDTAYIASRRRDNAGILVSELKDIVLFDSLKENDVPLFVPIISEKRDEIRKKLIANNIYCPVHWGKTAMHLLDESTEILYDQELSLIVDQRYSEEEMWRICNVVKSI